jgi:hypothetical protein
VTPQSLTSAFNLKTDRAGGRAGLGGLCHLPYYVVAMAIMSSFFAIKLDIHSDVPTPLILFFFFQITIHGTQLASAIG